MTHVAAAVTMAAIVYVLGTVVALHFLEPSYDPRHRFMSEYARGTLHGSMMTRVFIVAAVGAAAFAVALNPYATSSWPRMAHIVVVVAIFAAGLLASAAFPTDLNVTPVVRTRSGVIHDIVSTIPFALMVLAMGFSAFDRQPLTGALRNLAPVSGCLTAVAVLNLLFLVTFAVRGRRPYRWGGLAQRIIALCVMLWMFLTASVIFRDSTPGREYACGPVPASLPPCVFILGKTFIMPSEATL